MAGADRIAGAFEVVPAPPPAQTTDNVDLILSDRFRGVDRDAALDRLIGRGSGEPAVTEGGPAIPVGSGSAVKPEGQPLQIGSLRYIGATWRGAKAAALDLAAGIVETPKQMVGGARDAIESTLDLSELGEELLPMGGFVLEPTGGIAGPVIKWMGPADFAAAKQAGMKEVGLPEIAKGDTTSGGLVRGVTQFLSGFAFGGKGLQKLGVEVAETGGQKFTQAALKGAFADFAAFDAQEERLSNLVQEVPALQNPVTQFLAAEPTDSEAEGRLKNAVEGLGLGVVTEGFVRGLRYMRAARKVRAEAAKPRRAGQAARGGAGEDVALATREMNLLGPAEAPLTQKAQKLAASASETETGVPDEMTARALTDQGLTPLGKSEVFVNFSRIAAPEDIQRVIKDTADAMKDSINVTRRGVRSNQATKLAAADVDAWDRLMNRRSGEAMNAEESLAARELWIGAGDKLKQVAEAAVREPSPENLFQFRQMLATYHAIQKEVIAARTETARALQSWRIPAGANKESMLAIEGALNEAGGMEVTRDLARAVLAADANGGRAAMSAFAEKSLYATTRDAIAEYWINALLSGPKTHMVNMLSNSSVIALTMTEHAVAARLGRLLGGDDVVELGEAMAQMHGVRIGMKEAFVNAAKTFRSGQTLFGRNKFGVEQQREISSTAWNLRSDSLHGRAVDALGAVINTPGRALQAEDEFFKTIGYRMSLHAQAFRQAEREIRAGRLARNDAKSFMADVVANPPEELRLEAAAKAAYQTFTSEPGPLVRKLNALRFEYPMLRFVVPFLNTPANIFKYTLERTPLAPLASRYKQAIAKGGAEADMARTKMALGTFGSLLALDLAMDGWVTGSGPTNAAERQNLMRQGWRPYSIRVGNKYIAYNRMDPLGTLIGFGADLGEFVANADQMDMEGQALFERAMAATVFAAAENLTSKTTLQGFTELVEAVNQSDWYGPSYIKRFGASLLVPVGVREVARFMDPVARETATMIDEIKARLPGFSDDLPARHDVWGREIRYESGLGRVYDAVSPLYGSTFKPEPIDEAMAADGWFVGALAKAFNIDGVRVNFSDRPDIHSRYLELRGQTKAGDLGSDELVGIHGNVTLLEALNNIVQSDQEWTERSLRKIIRAYQDAAKEALIEEFPELLERATENAAKKRRLPPLPEDEEPE